MSKAWWSKGYYSGYWGRSPGSSNRWNPVTKRWESSDDDYDDSTYYDRSGMSTYRSPWYGGSKKKDEEDDDDEEETRYSWKEAYKSRYRSSLGYSTSRLSESVTSYSSYSWGWGKSRSSEEIDKTSELIAKAYKSTRDMIVILDFPFHVQVQLSSSGDELGYDTYKDTKTIFIPTKVFDDSTYNDADKINICCGLGVHEASHLKFTEVMVLNQFLNKIAQKDTIDLPDGTKVDSKKCGTFLMSLINLIEDERIENQLLIERPGYTEFIDKAKEYQYRKFIKSFGSGMPSGDVKEAQFRTFMINLYRLIRYPEDLDEEVLERYSEQYKKIQSHLTPLPTSTKQSCITGLNVYQEIIKVFSDYDFKTEDGTKSMGKISRMELDALLETLGKNMKKGYIVCYAGSDSKAGSGGLSVSSEYISDKINNEPIISKLVTGMAERGTKKMTYFETIKGDKEKYQKIVKRICQSVPAIKKLIRNIDKNYDFNIYGCRSGLLDTAKLAEAYQGVPQVYIRQGQVRTNKSTVCVLIDESGSMNCYCRDYSGRDYGWGDEDAPGTKITKAKEAAILLNEALGSLPGVDLYIYGHTADTTCSGSTNIRVYKEGKKKMDPFALGNAGRNLYENRDGTAIYEVAKRVRKFTQSKVTMFILSDGQPAAHNYWGLSAMNDVKSNVSKIEADGFTVIEITIDQVRDVEKMFNNVVKLEGSVMNLPKLLGNMIKKAVVADKKTTIS